MPKVINFQIQAIGFISNPEFKQQAADFKERHEARMAKQKAEKERVSAEKAKGTDLDVFIERMTNSLLGVKDNNGLYTEKLPDPETGLISYDE